MNIDEQIRISEQLAAENARLRQQLSGQEEGWTGEAYRPEELPELRWKTSHLTGDASDEAIARRLIHTQHRKYKG